MKQFNNKEFQKRKFRKRYFDGRTIEVCDQNNNEESPGAIN